MITVDGHAKIKNTQSDAILSNQHLYVNCCGVDRMTNRSFKTSRPKGMLDFYILYVTDGELTGTIDAANVEIKTGDIVIIPPNCSHVFYYNYTKLKQVYWLHIAGTGVKTMLEDTNLQVKEIHQIGYSESLTIILNDIIRELQMKRSFYEYNSAGLASQLLANVARKIKGSELISNDIQKLIIMLHENYTQTHKVEELAKSCGLTKYHFIHKFKTYTGCPPMKYIQNLRLTQAKKLLKTTNLSIKEISLTVGYDDALYFSRVFKSQAGVSPQKYRC